jgi:hypothetical protein
MMVSFEACSSLPGKSAKRVFAQNDPAIHRFSEKNAPVEPGHDEGMKFKRSANAPGADWQAAVAGSKKEGPGAAGPGLRHRRRNLMTLAILFAFASATLLGAGIVTTHFGLRYIEPLSGASISVPSFTLALVLAS